MTRASVLEELRSCASPARARGLSRARSSGAFRNSLIPVVTIVGLQFGAVLTGTIITETIFAWPASAALDPVDQFRDYPVALGILVIDSMLMLIGNIFSDMIYATVDPRIRFD